MVITLTTIVMDMSRDDEVAYDFEAGHDAALEMRVSGIETQLNVRQARLLEKIFQICGRRHIAGRVLESNRDASLFGEQGEEFEGTERRIPATLVRLIAMPRHMQNAIAERYRFHQVQRPLHFVHRLLTPNSFRVGNQEWRAAFAPGIGIASRRRVGGVHREIIYGEPGRQFTRVIGGVVIEMSARTK